MGKMIETDGDAIWVVETPQGVGDLYRILPLRCGSCGNLDGTLCKVLRSDDGWNVVETSPETARCKIEVYDDGLCNLCFSERLHDENVRRLKNLERTKPGTPEADKAIDDIMEAHRVLDDMSARTEVTKAPTQIAVLIRDLRATVAKAYRPTVSGEMECIVCSARKGVAHADTCLVEVVEMVVCDS